MRVQVGSPRRLWDRVVPKRLDEICRLRRGRCGRRDDGEGRRVALLVDVRRRDDLDPLGSRERILQVDEPRIGAALVAPCLGQLLGELGLKLLRLLLLRRRGLLLALELANAGPTAMLLAAPVTVHRTGRRLATPLRMA